MLERLDQIDGVEASSANYTGTMIRISVSTAATREKVAEVVQKDLSAGNRKPARLNGVELKEALRKEEWRAIQQIGQLSAIEFRTLALGRVKAFVEAEKLGEGVADKLLQLAEREWERLAEVNDSKEAKTPPHWKGRYSQFATVFCEQARELLTADQRERLSQAFMSRFEKLPTSEKK